MKSTTDLLPKWSVEKQITTSMKFPHHKARIKQGTIRNPQPNEQKQ